MHGQHDHQLLLNKKVHGDVLDSFAGVDCRNFAKIYTDTLSKLQEKTALQEDAQKLKAESDYHLNAYKEITNASLKPDEEEELESELSLLQNKEKIAEALHTAHQGIYESEINAAMILEDAKKAMHGISKFSKKYEEVAELIDDALAKTRESGHILSSMVEDIDFSADSMDKILDRQALIKDFKRKYQKSTIEELLLFADECGELAGRAENLDSELAKLESEYTALLDTLKKEALTLSQQRQQAGLDMQKKIEDELSFLGMESAKFEVKIHYAKQESSFLTINGTPVFVSDKGIDRVEFMIAANGGEPKPLVKTASGGEISRIMLSIKSALAQSDPVGTGVFDEIDTGIGGMTAHNVALKMKEISKLRQIFCITHLAQIAAKADYHYQVVKANEGGRVFTNVVLLNKDERIKEIARMLGGNSANSESLAQEMIDS